VSNKVTPIGQGVDSNRFKFKKRSFENLVNVLYVGRTDVSKNIPGIIKAVESSKLDFPNLQLSIVGGGPALSTNYDFPWIHAHGRMARSELPLAYKNSDIFIHAFQGSLDKVLIEAVLCGLPVITDNDEFKKFFKVFGVRSTSISVISGIVESNYQTALLNHELEGWIQRIVNCLVPEKLKEK
jgi:glycosyltransferase involved in cell wall biosynthesis